MSAATMTKHKPTELQYEGTVNGTAVFSSASKRHPERRNWTYVDVTTQLVACECDAPDGTCWHCDWALTAYAMTQVAGFVAGLTDAALVEVGAAAGAKVEAGTASVTDSAVYWECKRAWLARREAARAALAVVEEWETLSYSDRHIDQHFDGRRGEIEYERARAVLAELAQIAA